MVTYSFYTCLINFKSLALQFMQSKSRYKPKTSFSRRPCANQIISYIVIASKNISFWALIQNNYTCPSSRWTMMVLFSISTFVLVVTALLASCSDPSDPVMIEYKNGNSSAINSCKSPCLYCQHCDSYVKATSRHCKICDRCVQRFDHHCIWINNCVGSSNYRIFMVLIVSVFSNMLVYITSVGLLWAQAKWKEYLISMVACWFISSVVMVLAILIFGLIILHLFLIYRGLTTFDYIMSKRNSQIAPIQMQTFTNSHFSEPNQRQFRQQLEPGIKREGEQHSQQSQQNEQNHQTEESVHPPPLSAFHNIDNQQKASQFQSIQRMKSTHNSLPLQKQTQKVIISKNKSEMLDEIQIEEFNDFYKKHRGLKILVGPAVMIKPKRTQSFKLIRKNSLKSDLSRYSKEVPIDDFEVAGHDEDNNVAKGSSIK